MNPATPCPPSPMNTPITSQMVNDLRQKTGAGMMACKKALVEAHGNMDESIAILRRKGAVTAVEKAKRAANSGLIESYIHIGGKVGAMIEVSCETDFVARNGEFRSLCHDLCLQIVAASPRYVRREDVPEAELARERERHAAEAKGKPPAVMEQLVEGEMEKYYSTVCLLDQPFVKQPDRTVRDMLTEKVAKIGENLRIRRFVRFQVGAGS